MEIEIGRRPWIRDYGYEERNRILRRLGYATYNGYTRSKLWAAIRQKVFAVSRKCACCYGKATQIHHNVYTEANLSGESIVGLHPVCAKCHKRIEKKKGAKVTLNEARERFNKRRGHYHGSKGIMCPRCQVNRKFHGGLCPPCAKAGPQNQFEKGG